MAMMNTILPTQLVQPVLQGATNQEQNLQFVTMPFNQLPNMSFNEFSSGESTHNFRARGSFRGGSRRGRGFTRNQGEIDAYSMDVAPISIFENQVIPMGLHNLSKSFKPNLATTRVFSLGTKFIPVWNSMKIVKPFAKFEDFHRKFHQVLLLGIKTFI